MFCAYLLATALIPLGYQAILLTSIGVGFIVPILLLLMPRDNLTALRHQSQLEIVRMAFQTIRSGRTLFILAAFIMLLSGSIGLLEEYFALYTSWNGFSTESVPLLLAGALLGGVAVQWTAHWFDRYDQRLLFSFVSLAGVILFTTSFFPGWIGFIGFFVFLRIFKLIDTSLNGRLQTLINTNARSTVVSLITFVAEILAIVGAGIVVLLQTQYSDVYAVALLGLGLAVLAFTFTLLKPSRG